MPDLTDLRQADLEALNNYLLDTAAELGDYADSYGEYFLQDDSVIVRGNELDNLHNAAWVLYKKVNDEKQRRMKAHE